MTTEGMHLEDYSPSRGLKRQATTPAMDLTRLGSMESLPSFCMTPVPTTTLADTLEHVYTERREELIAEDGSICTPLKVLKDLAFEYGTPLEVVTYEVHLPVQSPYQANIRNRVFLRVGQFTGHGETTRHRLAVQLAAGDLLEQIKIEKKGEIAQYGLIPGCRISPLIYEDLRELCRMEKLASMPSYIQINPSKIGSSNLFAFKCSIGQAEVTGTSDSIFLAKRLAAKKMFELLTGDLYPDDRIAIGNGCLSLEEMRGMGIKPITAARSEHRGRLAIGSENDDKMSGRQKRSSLDSPDELHTDDFAEEEDHVVIVRQQLHMMELNDKVESNISV